MGTVQGNRVDRGKRICMILFINIVYGYSSQRYYSHIDGQAWWEDRYSTIHEYCLQTLFTNIVQIVSIQE